jgi:hypothetical protein
MENLFTKLMVLITRLLIVGFYTSLVVSILFIFLNFLFFQNFDLLNEITIKYFGIAYLIGFVINYTYLVTDDEDDEND